MAAKVGQTGTARSRRARRAAPPPPPPKPWWKRWWERPRTRRRVLTLSLLAILCLLVFVTARLFVVPHAELPQRADAVVTLAGDEVHVTKALELMNRQVAPVLVVSGGANPARTLAYRLCTQPQPFEVLCPAAGPAVTAPTTNASVPAATLRNQPEAQTVGRIATERGWSQLALVGLPEELNRTRLLVERCTAAHVMAVMVQSPVSQRLQRLGPEAADYFRAVFLDRSC